VGGWDLLPTKLREWSKRKLLTINKVDGDDDDDGAGGGGGGY
jgi:hypothetical protein